MRPRRTIDILGLGAVAVDDLIFVESYPPPDAKARVVRRERHCGGLTATALTAAARLGARCAYAGVLGNDALSHFAATCLEQEGIDVSWAQRTPSARPVYSNIIVDQRRGTRNIFYDLERVVGASVRTPARLIRSCRVLFVDHVGVAGMVRAARLARQAGIPVVADLETACDPQFHQLLALADHLILSRDFARALTGARSPAQALCKLARPDRQVAVVTCGDEGCWYLARSDAAPRRQPAFKVDAVDTTGCGDVFHGAYAFALARGLGLEERIRLAAAAAALKATRPGGQAGIPSLAAVRRLLNHELETEPR
jgi:sugar/nucleoside kinase (ribokinase family)